MVRKFDMAEAEALDYEAWHGTPAPRGLRLAALDAPPRHRARNLSFYLVGLLTGLLIAWGATAFALHMEDRIGADLARAEEWRAM